MQEYIYEDISSPDLDQIHLDIVSSDMDDKSIEYCRWDENPVDEHLENCLHIVFTNELSQDDKTKLDNIISAL